MWWLHRIQIYYKEREKRANERWTFRGKKWKRTKRKSKKAECRDMGLYIYILKYSFMLGALVFSARRRRLVLFIWYEQWGGDSTKYNGKLNLWVSFIFVLFRCVCVCCRFFSHFISFTASELNTGCIHSIRNVPYHTPQPYTLHMCFF